MAMATAAQQNKLSLQALNYSYVLMFSLATKVAENKIEVFRPPFFSPYTWFSMRASSGETTRLVVIQPCLCSIRNGSIW